ncbi:MAG TPA: tetratricopeptide repeat protein [Bryocella sp.]|nr:tetratricopeptide repeat protein [Bryocella sp.]
MRRILSCVLFAIVTSASLSSAQEQNSDLNYLGRLSRYNQLPQLIQTANALLANQNLAPAVRAVTLTYLGHAYQKSGDTHEATTCYENALALLERDGSHPVEYATTLGALATLYADTGQMDTARHVLLRSADVLEKDGDHHEEIALIWSDLAVVAVDKHSSRDAHKFMARALDESQRATDFSSDATSALLTAQGSIAGLDGDPRTAITDYQRSLDLWKLNHADQHPDTGWLYVLLGGAYLQAHDTVSARQMTSHGLNLLEASSGPQNPRFLAAELVYSKVLDASGSHNEASKLRKEAQATLKADSKRSQGEISIAALR